MPGAPRAFTRARENLLTNAAKFSPAGSRIGVSAEQRNGEVTVAVADEGLGIPADDLERVFERFYRADGGRARPGTGIGLAIVKEFVEAQNGRVWVESTLGQGTTFGIVLARAELETGSG